MKPDGHAPSTNLIVRAALLVAAALLLALALASTAHASKSVVGYFGNPTTSSGATGGLFNSNTGVAVNVAGTGGAGAGDVYVVDSGNRRIQQFSSSGTFIRAWGRDVVSPGGSGDTNERQTVTIGGGPTGGTFKLTLGAGTTANINFNATAAEVQSALEAISTVGAGNVNVAGGSGGPYAVEFVAGKASTDQAQMTASASLTPSGTATVATTQDGASFEICTVAAQCKAGTNTATATLGAGGTLNSPQGLAINQVNGHVYVSDQTFLNVTEYDAVGNFVRTWGQDVVNTGPDNNPAASAVQTLTIPGSVAGGTFDLTFMGQTATGISPTVTAASLQTTLRGLSSIGSPNVTVTGGPGQTAPLTITFAGTLANAPVSLISVSNTNLIGGAATLVNTKSGSTGFEICNVTDVCKTGVTAGTAGAFATGASGHLAVAPSGTPNAGNVLVGDPGNRRVQEFDSAGAFVRAFGWDVIKPGVVTNEPRNEQQKLVVSAVAGTFTSTFGANTTGALPFNVPASGGVGPTASLQNALEALASVGAGNVTVTGGPGDASGSNPYVVTFIGALADTDVAQIAVNPGGLRAGAGQTLTCTATTSNGEVSGTTTTVSMAFQWLRNGVDIPGATSSSYTTVGGDAGNAVQCRAFGAGKTFQNPDVPGVQVSNPATIVYPHPEPEPGTAPETIAAPTTSAPIDFNGLGGQTLTCAPGSWTGSPTFIYQWYRNGEPMSGKSSSNTYVLTSADVATPQNFFGAAYQCAVTGTYTGGIVTKLSNGLSNGNTSFTKVNVSVPNTLASVTTLTAGAKFEVCSFVPGCKTAANSGGEVGQFGTTGPTRVAEDSSGAIYAVENVTNFRVQKFTPQVGPPVLQPSVLAPSLLSGTTNAPFTAEKGLANNPTDIAIGTGGMVLVAKGFPLGSTAPCLDGSTSPGESRVQEVTSDGLTLADTHMTCAGLAAATSSSNSGNGLAVDTASGKLYFSTRTFGQRIYILNNAMQPVVNVDPVVPTTTGANVSGTVNPQATGYPNPPAANYQVEYKLPSAATWTKFSTPFSLGIGTSPIPFSTTLVGLLPATEYEARVVSTKEFNAAQSISSPQSFTTLAAKPDIQSFSTSKVTASSADLNAKVDPRGSATTYHFEYGDTPLYGQSTPEESIGSGQGAQSVTAHIDGLGTVTHHFRVVATNSAGTSTTADQTFDYYAPNCPNAEVRQQTKSSYLPDCRAYELASPEYAAGTIIFPGTGPNSPYATNPSRIGFGGAFGAVPGSGATVNSQGDLYVATRTNSGWSTKYIGLPGNETYYMGVRPGAEANELTSPARSQRDVLFNEDLSELVNWSNGNPSLKPNPFDSNAPYIWNPEGELIGRWPTNVTEVPEGEKFIGEIRTSDDLSHFVFSSNLVFAPGGVPGDIYDNDTDTGSIEIISRAENGSPIQGVPIEVSSDGSHILMRANGALYMRSGGATQDVTGGKAVNFAGMTSDGARVYFTSAEQLTSDDHDASLDLFVWEEKTDSITRVSAGSSGSVGDVDTCTTSWTTKCGVTLISNYRKDCTGNACDTYERFFSLYAKLNSARGGNGLSDNFLASKSGDIYFYSPEQLTGGTQGAIGRPNLYLYRNGSLRFIGTLDPGVICEKYGYGGSQACSEGPIVRMNVTPDGRFAAFITPSRLTSAFTGGFTSMYLYDVEKNELTCVSCLPSGDSPTRNVYGSQNGLFLTEDGRVFFSTTDGLVPQDTNKIADVYEYVNGRPQIISAGTGSGNEPSYGTDAHQILNGGWPAPGLVGVTADGRDVYFSTYDVLVPQDRNGGSIKIYDARTNGGFPVDPERPGCPAADECHGPASSAPSAAQDGTGATLGDRGNVTAEPRKARKKKKRKKARKSVKKHVAQKGARSHG